MHSYLVGIDQGMKGEDKHLGATVLSRSPASVDGPAAAVPCRTTAAPSPSLIRVPGPAR